MRKHMHRGLVAFLAWAALAAGCQTSAIPPDVPASTPAALAALVSQLATEKEWSASSRLQKLGAPAIAALIAHLQRDPFADRDHGNHSPTMKVLEKIGEPALPAMFAALTPALLQSGDADDLRALDSLIMVMGRINRSQAAPHLVRVARSAVSQVRPNALAALLGWDDDPPPLSRPARWQPCVVFERYFSGGISCPDKSEDEARSLAAALPPLLPAISAVLDEASPPDMRLTAARLLARWGTGALKSRGDRELVAVSSGAPPYVRNQAIQALGVLHVRSSAGLLVTQFAGADEEGKRVITEALFRLDDPAWVVTAAELINSSNADTRRWSIRFARDSHNLSFVPHLIEHLDDRGFNGTTRTESPPGQKAIVTRGALAEDALEALRRVTFEDLGFDKEGWRRWLKANDGAGWESLLNQFVQRRLTQLPSAEAAVMNGWMGQLSEADSATVLPFIEQLLNHPRLHLSSVGPNEFSVGGGPPPVVLLLLELVHQGSSRARALLYQCSTSRDPTLRDVCPFAVAVFDRPAALDSLVRRLKDADSRTVSKAAESLVQLGDARGIPTLIENLMATDGLSAWANCLTLQRYTQEDIPCDREAPVAARREIYLKWREWWQGQRGNFTVKVKAAQIDAEMRM
jgi:HEAT repeat protein